MNLKCQICKEECFRFCTTCTAYLCNSHLCEHLTILEGLYEFTSNDSNQEEYTGNSFLANREVVKYLETSTLKQWEERYKTLLITIKTELALRTNNLNDDIYNKYASSYRYFTGNDEVSDKIPYRSNKRDKQPNRQLLKKLSSLSSFNLAVLINNIKGDV